MTWTGTAPSSAAWGCDARSQPRSTRSPIGALGLAHPSHTTRIDPCADACATPRTGAPRSTVPMRHTDTLEESVAIKHEAEIGGQILSMEAGKLAEQADGAVCSATATPSSWRPRSPARSPREGADFFPLTVDYEERMYAAGQDPGRLHQARVAPVGGRHPGDAPHRPADPPALPEGLLQRRPGRPDGPLDRPGERPRHPRAERRLGRAEHQPASRSWVRSAPFASAASAASSSPTRRTASSPRASSTSSWPARATR